MELWHQLSRAVTSFSAFCSEHVRRGSAAEVLRGISAASAARPKSVMRMLAGFRSRCSTPRSRAAPRPAQILRANSTALSCGS